MVGRGYSDKGFIEAIDLNGVYDALEYGMTADDLVNSEGELAKAWAKLEEAFKPLEAALYEYNRIAEKIEEDE